MDEPSDSGFLNVLEGVHAHLDAINRLIARLKTIPARSNLEIAELHELVDAVGEMGGDELGIDAATLDKLERFHGRLRQPVALHVATRMKTHLLNLDRDFARYADAAPRTETAEESAEEPYAPLDDPKGTGPLAVRAVAWQAVPDRPDIKRMISEVATLLDEICRHVQQANLPEDEQALTRIEKAQLVAILETTISVLRAPMVERGLIARTGRSLGEAATKTAEREVQKGLGDMMAFGRKGLLEILRQIFTP